MAPKLIHGVSELNRTALCRCLLRGVAVAAVGLGLVTVMVMAMVREVKWCRVSLELLHTTKLRGGVSNPGNAWLGSDDWQRPLGLSQVRKFGQIGWRLLGGLLYARIKAVIVINRE